jgi:predicted nucleic acid-binding protein
VSSPAVVDTSVAAKWVFTEPHSAQARLLLGDPWELHAPDFLDLELDHVVAKKHRRGQVSTRQANEARSVFSAFPVLRHRSHALRDPAFDIACAHFLGTYDALFAALAILLEVRLVTADRRLHDALTGNPLLADRLLWLPDLAAADGSDR